MSGRGTRQSGAPTGQSWTVLWHPGSAAERQAIPANPDRVALLHAAEKLQALGPRLGFPHSSAVQGQRGKGFRELRPRRGRSPWRAIYRQVNETTFVILAVGAEAEHNQRKFDAAVDRAAERFASLAGS